MAEATKVAFSHETGTTEMNPVKSTKPGWLSAGNLTGTRLITLIVILFGLFILWMFNRNKLIERIHSVSQLTQPSPQGGLHKEATLEAGTWWGQEVFLDTNESLDWNWLADCWGQMRLNKNDSEVYDIPPRNSPKKMIFTRSGPITIVEFQIKPGETVSHGTVAYYKRLAWERPHFR